MTVPAGWIAWLIAAAVPCVQDPPPEAPVDAPAEAPQEVPPLPEPPEVRTEVIPREQRGLYERTRIVEPDRVTVFLRAGHADAARCAKMIEVMNRFITANFGWLHISEELHSIVVSDRPDRIETLLEALNALEMPDPQVYLEARVAEVIRDRLFQLGISGNLASAAIFQSGLPKTFIQDFRVDLGFVPEPRTAFRLFFEKAGIYTFDALLQAFVERGNAQILSQPNITVNSGDTATIDVVDQIPVPRIIQGVNFANLTYNAEDVGVKVKLTPHVLGRDVVELEVEVTSSSVVGNVTLGTGVSLITVPVISLRKTTTHLTCLNGQEVVISGLIKRENTERRRGLPFLSEMPVLGFLFRRDETTSREIEIVFVVKPRILDLAREPTEELIDPRQRR